MELSIQMLAEAREAAGAALEELGLAAYLFEVEPREGPWELRVECAVPEGWETLIVPVDRRQLLASRTDRALRDQLLADWRRALAACITG